MNETQQRIAIAEFCGWVKEIHPTSICPEGRNFWRSPNTEPGHATHTEFSLPDYLNDLNAMISALEYLPKNKIEEFGEELLTILLLSGEIKDYPVTLPAECGFREIRGPLDLVLAIVKSTPQQLAEAFLRTLGLWKD